MAFNSLQYFVLLPVVLAIYWSLRNHRTQNLFLLIVSYAFYAYFDWRFLGLLLLSTTVDYLTGTFLARADDNERRRRWTLSISVLTNLSILGFFKYFNFFIDSADRLFTRLGVDVSMPVLQIALPVAISFFTFHGMSYTIDVYRRHIPAASSFVTFATFVAFFPQLVAGPIGRANFQLPQFENVRRRPDADHTFEALALILLGLFKKVVLADAAAPIANAAFANPTQVSTGTLIIGAYAFAIQIYGDFSGYTDMARGSARLLGFELPPNFEQPYLSRNITEFWRTWHISLSSWLRDFLYVPLGGNRGSPSATYRNLIIVMVLGGLWHGAALTFVFWGLGHGLLLAGHRWWSRRRTPDRRAPAAPGAPSPGVPGVAGGVARIEGATAVATPVGTVVTAPVDAPASGPTPAPLSGTRDLVCRLLTFHVVAGLWIVFRSAGMGNAWNYLLGILSFRGGALNLDDVVLVAAAGATTLVLDLFQRRAREGHLLAELNPSTRGVVVGVALVAILVFSGGAPVPFIYFQF